MTFAEKLKSIRKQAGMSQEQLAEKLSVSRQAVTKWETDAGIPDIENIMAISALFDISIDELLSNERGAKKPTDYLYESITEYDIDEPKRYDMKFGGAKQFQLSGYEGEKIRAAVGTPGNAVHHGALLKHIADRPAEQAAVEVYDDTVAAAAEIL